MPPRLQPERLAICAAIILPVSLLGGCVERLLQVRSDPPGAEVRIDGTPVGQTPVDVEFHWYGGREITLRKPGFRTVRRTIDVSAPWWQVFPFDLFTDLLLPFRIHDIRRLHFILQAEEDVPYDDVRERADKLRRRLRDRE